MVGKEAAMLRDRMCSGDTQLQSKIRLVVDVLAPVALAIQLHTQVDALQTIYAPHPTISDLAFVAARCPPM